jgi:hypothetical protein
MGPFNSNVEVYITYHHHHHYAQKAVIELNSTLTKVCRYFTPTIIYFFNQFYSIFYGVAVCK